MWCRWRDKGTFFPPPGRVRTPAIMVLEIQKYPGPVHNAKGNGSLRRVAHLFLHTVPLIRSDLSRDGHTRALHLLLLKGLSERDWALKPAETHQQEKYILFMACRKRGDLSEGKQACLS
jgi:hypothetical protein